MKTMSLTMPAIRIKLTGICNRTCSFCHEEGDMKRIQNIIPADDFFTCIGQIMKKTGIQRIMLTGGEPTIHPKLVNIICGLKEFSNEISITTNGIKKISLEEWQRFKEVGLTKVIISIHDTLASDLQSLESVKKPYLGLKMLLQISTRILRMLYLPIYIQELILLPTVVLKKHIIL